MHGFRQRIIRLALVLLAAAAGSHVQAGIVWNESSSQGDLSNSQTTPTQVTLSFLGTNSVLGTVGPGDQQDWITIHVPTGTQLSNLNLQSYSSTDAQGFIGFHSGTSFVGNPETSPGAYAGYSHFGTGAKNGSLPATNLVGTDLLPLMANTSQVAIGANGFTIPLSSGNYTFLIQQLGASTSYQFDFVTTSAVAVPEPSSLCLVGAVFGGAAALRAYRKRRAQI